MTKIAVTVTPSGKVTDCTVDGHSIAGALTTASELVLRNDSVPVLHAEIAVTDVAVTPGPPQ